MPRRSQRYIYRLYTLLRMKLAYVAALPCRESAFWTANIVAVHFSPAFPSMNSLLTSKVLLPMIFSK